MFIHQRVAARWIACCVLVLGPTAYAQRVECKLQETLPDLVTGSCSGMNAESAIAIQPMPGSSSDWTGAITLGSNPGLIDIVASQHGADAHYVFRSTMDWFNVSEFSPRANGRLVFDRSDIAAPTNDDIDILRNARRLLEITPTWDRSDDRNCNNDEPTALGLYCALVTATVKQMGKFYHRQPAMQRVRRAIEERWPDRVAGHRLADFNNHPATRLEDVIRVLVRAEELTRQDIP